jgi:hypothetical protein
VTVQWISKLGAKCGKVAGLTPRIGGFMGGYCIWNVLGGEEKKTFVLLNIANIQTLEIDFYSDFTKYLGYLSHHRLGMPAQRDAVP